jgi:hypothetical protein
VGGHPHGHRKDRELGEEAAFVDHYSFHIMDPEWGHLTPVIHGTGR